VSGAFAGERAVVVGLGVSGSAVARVLADEGADVRVSEARPDPDVPAELRALDVEVLAGGHDPSHLNGATVVVASPGVTPRSPVLDWARDRNIPVWGELELGARLTRVPYIGVTGTNGKTTTTSMIAACLSAGGIDAVACGNIGHPFPLAARDAHDVLVVECSSFQLEMQDTFHPVVSVLLNVAPDHLDWHGSFEAYVDAKAKLFANQTNGDAHIGNRDDETSAAVSSRARCEVSWFTTEEPSAGDTGFVDGQLVGRWNGDERLGGLGFSNPAMNGDAAACAAACRAFGAAADAIRAGLSAFVPAPHRGEVVAIARGVRFVDDSKATNPHATLAAVDDRTGVVLIAGGDAKGVDLSPIGQVAERLAGVVAIGASADDVVSIFDGRVPTRKAGSVEEAARTAFEIAPDGGTVLLAPGCASWDMFRDYEERGERFTRAARELERTASA
jgi:UDP-N-acetylmuramoylalanine--D-glutamate ligase